MSKIKQGFEGLQSLSLGISMVVAVVIGVGVGILLKNLTGIGWLLWLGVVWGIGAAVLNVYRAYAKLKKEMDEEADRRNSRMPLYDDDDDA
jgi:F0F1-type ATP synthase assembly protein I